MTHPKDHIKVGRITLLYSRRERGWLTPGGRVIANPLKAHRMAETLNSATNSH